MQKRAKPCRPNLPVWLITLMLSVIVGRGPHNGATTFADHAIRGHVPFDGQVRAVIEPAGER
jgi:hypothetical protein